LQALYLSDAPQLTSFSANSNIDTVTNLTLINTGFTTFDATANTLLQVLAICINIFNQ
jgi:hypothetical protein